MQDSDVNRDGANQQLKEGDFVGWSSGPNSEAYVGVIKRFTPKSVEVEVIRGSRPNTMWGQYKLLWMLRKEHVFKLSEQSQRAPNADELTDAFYYFYDKFKGDLTAIKKAANIPLSLLHQVEKGELKASEAARRTQSMWLKALDETCK